MIKQECIGIPDMILLLMKDKSKNNSVPRRGLFLQTAVQFIHYRMLLCPTICLDALYVN